MLIDANVFNGFFQVEIGKQHILQGCPKTLIDSASHQNPIYHDYNGLIEHEWRNVVDQEWFDVWLAAQFSTGTIALTAAINNNSLESKLKNVGFPTGRDIVYVRTGLAIAATNGSCLFFTEDIDFYDPTKKGCDSKTRKKIIANSTGPVCKLLGKSKIDVTCVP